MKNLKILMFAFMLIFAMSIPMSAGTVTYNTGLAGPGTYFGSGNVNSGWTVYTNGNLELGVGGLIRYLGSAPEDGSTYYVPTGPTEVLGKTGSAWGWKLSANTQVGGGNLLLSDYNFNMRITNLTTGGLPLEFNPNLIGDNSHPSSPYNPLAGFQNAESLHYFVGAPLNYDMNAQDNYKIELLAQLKSDVAVNGWEGVSMEAVTTPEPSTYLSLGAGLAGLALTRFRRRNR